MPARKSYQDLFANWKNADPNLPVLAEARAEYGKLQSIRAAKHVGRVVSGRAMVAFADGTEIQMDAGTIVSHSAYSSRQLGSWR